MFCRIAGMAAAALLVSGSAWAQSSTDQQTGAQTTTTTEAQTTTTETRVDTSDDRPRLEIAAFAGWTFNQTLDFTQSPTTTTVTNFYDSVGPKDRFGYGASLGYDVTRNLMVGFRWSGQNSRLALRNFNSSAAAAIGWKPGTIGTGTTATTAFPAVLVTTNGTSPYEVGKLDVNNFHGIVGWNFGPDDALVRPFVYGGAGVTRYGDVDYTFMQPVTTPATATSPAKITTSPVSARLPGTTKFSTTWGLGLNIVPRKGVGIRIAGNFTPTRLSNPYQTMTSATVAYGPAATASSVSVNTSWWCNAFSGCANRNYVYANQWSVLGGLTLRF